MLQHESLNFANLDLEWTPYTGKYSHNKTQIFAAAFCTNWGEELSYISPITLKTTIDPRKH